MIRIWKIIYKVGSYINSKINSSKNKREEKKWLNKFGKNERIIFECNDTFKIYLYKNSILSKYINIGFEKNEREFVINFLKKGDVFYDIGANIGLFSLLASKVVGEKGLVYSFEPTPITYSRLLDNISLNNFSNIKTFNIGLSDKVGKLNLNVSTNGYDAWNSFAKINDKLYEYTVEIEVNSLDNFLANHNKNISLIKIDVEGWEMFVLKGGEQLLKTSTEIVLLVEFTDENAFAAGYYSHELFDLLISWGYEWFSYENKQLNKEIRRLYYPYLNLIAAKNENFLREKLKINY